MLQFNLKAQFTQKWDFDYVIYSPLCHSKLDFADFIFFTEHKKMLVRKFILLFPDMKANGVQAGVKFLKGQKANTIGPFESCTITSLQEPYLCKE